MMAASASGDDAAVTVPGAGPAGSPAVLDIGRPSWSARRWSGGARVMRRTSATEMLADGGEAPVGGGQRQGQVVAGQRRGHEPVMPRVQVGPAAHRRRGE